MVGESVSINSTITYLAYHVLAMSVVLRNVLYRISEAVTKLHLVLKLDILHNIFFMQAFLQLTA